MCTFAPKSAAGELFPFVVFSSSMVMMIINLVKSAATTRHSRKFQKKSTKGPSVDESSFFTVRKGKGERTKMMGNEGFIVDRHCWVSTFENSHARFQKVVSEEGTRSIDLQHWRNVIALTALRVSELV